MSSFVRLSIYMYMYLPTFSAQSLNQTLNAMRCTQDCMVTCIDTFVVQVRERVFQSNSSCKYAETNGILQV